MQPAIRNDIVYLLQILEAIGKTQIYSEDFRDAEKFLESREQMNFDACLLMLSHIGEQSGKISAELKKKYKNIDWNKIRGLRNRVVHDYIGIDNSIIFEIIKNFLPSLKNRIHQIIYAELQTGDFLMDEFEVAKKSNFYRHIDFDAVLNS